jgi:hypothetical protein
MIKKNGIHVLTGQIWTIGKGTQKSVKEVNNLSFDIGNEVEITSNAYDGLFQVRDTKTNIRFDLTTRNLGRLISR